MPQNMDKTRSMITVDNERVSLPASVFLAPGSYTLNPDGSITIGGSIAGALVLGGLLTPAELPDATTEDWDLGSLADVSRIEVTSAGNTAAIGGIIPTDVENGQVIAVINVGAFDVTILNASAGSAAANRINSNGDIILPPGCGFLLVRPTGVAAWSGMGA